MDAALRALSTSGTFGAVLASILGLLGVVIGALVWMLKGMFTRWIDIAQQLRVDPSIVEITGDKRDRVI